MSKGKLKCICGGIARLKALYFCCCSDDSDDSDGALGTGLSLDPSTHHSALTVKTEGCEQEDGLVDSKPLNGVLVQNKGKIHKDTFIQHIVLYCICPFFVITDL